MIMQNFKRWALLGGLSAVVLALGPAGCSMFSSKQAKETGRTEAQVSDDKRITSTVEDELKTSSVYKFPDVGVNTFQGTVQLNGFVETDEQKRAAGEIAQRAAAGAHVINNIAVKSPQAPTPTGRSVQPQVLEPQYKQEPAPTPGQGTQAQPNPPPAPPNQATPPPANQPNTPQ